MVIITDFETFKGREPFASPTGVSPVCPSLKIGLSTLLLISLFSEPILLCLSLIILRTCCLIAGDGVNFYLLDLLLALLALLI